MISHMLQIKVPKIKQDHPDFVTRKLNKLARQMRKASGKRYRVDGRGQPCSFIQHARDQRVLVKISYSNNTKTKSWAAHGKYLQRDHAQIEGEKGHGFTKESQEVDICDLLNQWQEAGDPRIFKLIISPENANKLDLKEHARELMQRVEGDLGTKLEWVAIDHNNTEHGHLHLIIRGLDDKGQPLKIQSDYIAKGFRSQSQDIVTQKLGLRTSHDISIARANQIQKDYVTQIDRALRYKALDDVVSFDTKIPKNALSRERRLQEIKRLVYLSSIGLAEKVGKKKWRLLPDMEKKLVAMQRSNDIIKSLSAHRLMPSLLSQPLQHTVITESQPLTGKVIGMGLENELHDKRYLLLEDDKGKIHYIQASNAITKARDEHQFQNGDTIALSQKMITRHGKVMTDLHIEIKEPTIQQTKKSQAKER